MAGHIPSGICTTDGGLQRQLTAQILFSKEFHHIIGTAFLCQITKKQCGNLELSTKSLTFAPLLTHKAAKE